MKPAIKVENLGKQYTIGSQRKAYGSLRDSLTEAVKKPFRRRQNGHSNDETIWALRDVSFEVMPGEVVGIIGRNGAGKSTLLKILSRITEPTEGGVELHGKVGSLLEVGTGFHAELSGRENVYLNGAILGMKHAEIERKFDEIVAFAEVEKFLDTPVKYYSSGMYMRLAFAVAAHLEPEILIVDEVLAVGDSGFQNKCVEKMRSIAHSGCSILFVSHNMSAVQSLCTRGILLRNGRIVSTGKSASIIEEYFSEVYANPLGNIALPKSSADLKITRVYLSRDGRTPNVKFRMGDPLFITVEYEAKRPILQPYFSFGITDGGPRPLTLASMLIDGLAPASIHGRGQLTCRFHDLPFLPKLFQIWGSVRGGNGYGDIVDWQHLADFRLTETDARVMLGADPSVHHLQNDAPIYLSYNWDFHQEDAALSATRGSRNFDEEINNERREYYRQRI